ncbi:hypothetical protein ABIA39_007900 [Nocardia sp. GAS34]
MVVHLTLERGLDYKLRHPRQQPALTDQLQPSFDVWIAHTRGSRPAGRRRARPRILN